MIPENVMVNLVQNACFSADSVAIGFRGADAERTRASVTRALEALEANGLITVTPDAEWPEYYIPNPPYEFPFTRKAGSA